MNAKQPICSRIEDKGGTVFASFLSLDLPPPPLPVILASTLCADQTFSSH